MKGAAVILVTVFVASCVTFNEPVDPPTLEESIRQRIETAILSPFPARAVPMIDSASAELSDADRAGLRDRATTALAGRLVEALAEDEYRSAIASLRSLLFLGEGDRAPDIGLAEAYTLFADYLLGQDHSTAALAVFLKTPEIESLATTTLVRYGDLAVDHGNRHALETIVALLEDRDADVPQDYLELLENRPAPVDLLSGTATIWVDRGIRLEGGLGFPDRVIGSGFFVDPRGYLITNYHVIESEVDPEYEGFSRLYIRLPARPEQRIPARVIGYDRIFDLALIKAEISAPNLVPLSDVRSLEVGSRIFAIGSPGGLENTLTSGIISAVGRRFLQLGDAMQVDVPVNPGNSGGPLIDEQGRLAGVVFAGIEQFEGVNFAIPSHWIRHFVAELFQEGEVVHAWMGVAAYEVDGALEVAYVAVDSPAAHAGLRVGDRILSIDGRETAKIGDAQDILLGHYVGTLVPLRISREGAQLDRAVALDPRPFSPVEEALRQVRPPELFPVLFGMNVRETDSGPFLPEFVVTRIFAGEIADETGLSVDDPFTVQRWIVDDEADVAAVQIVVRRRKAGFVERGIQLAAFLEQDNFL